MPEVGSVKYKVELDNSGLAQQADSTESTLKSKFATVGKAAGKVLAGGVVAAGAAAVATGKQVWSMAKDVAAAGDVIDKNSQKVGFSAEAYQKWDYAMQLAGTSMDASMMGIKTLTNTFDDALKGTDSAVEKFTRLGLSMEEIQGLSREDLFATVVTALQGVTDETERAALANDLLGRSGQELMPLLNGTAEDLAKVMEETEQYGMIMSDDAVKSSAAFQDSLTKLNGTLSGLKNGAIAALLPGLTDLVGGITDVANGTKQADVVILEGIQNILNEMQARLPQFLERGMDMITGLINGLVQNMPQFIAMGTELLQNLVQRISDHMPEIVDSGIKLIEALIKGAIQMMPKLAEAAFKLVVALAQALIRNIPEILRAGGQIITDLKNKFTSINWGEVGRSIIQGIARGITGALGLIADAARNAAQSALDTAKGWLGIHSPSKRAAQEIGLPYMQGIAEGIEDNADILDNSAEGAVHRLIPSMPDVTGLASNIGASISATAQSQITVVSELDGREIARGTAWYMNEQLAWEER